MDDPKSHVPVLLLIACGLFFLRLDCALLEPEETRYAEIPREMLAAGEWIVPAYHGQPYFDKPPLLYWQTMVSYSVFGVHDWSARLVPGLCGVLTILTAYVWGRCVFNVRIACFAAMVLALTPRFIYLGRFVATDAVLNLGVVAALMCLHVASSRPSSRWWWLGAGAACGWGLLAKGPVVAALIAPPFVVYLAMNANASRPRLTDICLFVGAMLLVAGPWYAYMLGQPDFAEHFFWKHHVLRYVDPFDHQKPFWFYLPDLFVGTLPWSVLLLPLGFRVGRTWLRSLSFSRPVVAPPGQARWRRRVAAIHGLAGQSSLHRDEPGRGGARDDASMQKLMFPLLAATWCLLFFSISGSKRVGYILPCFAPLALAIGGEIEHLLQTKRLSRRILNAAVATTGGLCFLGVGLLLPWYNERFSLRTEVLAAREQALRSSGVVCYPRNWDSVPFYLECEAIVFTSSQRSELAAYLHAHDDTVVFTRDDADTLRLVDELRGSLNVEAIAQQGPHRAIWIYRRDLPPALAARREEK